MFRHKIKLFTLLGFPIQIDLSWLFIAMLLAWSLARGFFPARVEGLSERTYWVMGILGALALFACVVLHELGHAVVARRHGEKIKGITLFIFGGVSEMTDEPHSAGAEFWIAVSGPAVSVLLAVAFHLVSRVAMPTPAAAVLEYLALINVLLAGFNMLPAFPLDGGRVLRAALWKWKDNLRWATRIASEVGSGFGVALIVLAALNLLAGSLVGAIWWFVLGLFVRGSARMAYRQLVWRELLAHTSVRRLMNAEPRTVPPETRVDEFVEEYLYRYHHRMFPAVRDGELLGSVGTEQVKTLPQPQWHDTTVGELLVPCSGENTISADADAEAALATMNRTGKSRLMAVDGGHLVGIITLKDLWTYIARRVEIEGDGSAHP